MNLAGPRALVIYRVGLICSMGLQLWLMLFRGEAPSASLNNISQWFSILVIHFELNELRGGAR